LSDYKLILQIAVKAGRRRRLTNDTIVRTEAVEERRAI